jgi:hypothetical protein
VTRLIAALLLAGSAAAPPPAADPQATTPAGGPRLVLEPEGFDFGRALPGKALTKEFSLRNTGSGPLVIEKLSSSCACTAFLLDEKDRRLEPGRSAALRVTFTTPRRPGRAVETVSVKSNDPERGVAEIKVEATVTEK